MIGLARARVKETQSRYVLRAHDWFRVNFSKHQSKFNKTQMSHALDVGYELQASLLEGKESQCFIVGTVAL